MLASRKIGYGKADEYMKQEPLDVIRTVKLEKDNPLSLNNYRKDSSTIENISTDALLKVKAEPDETDTRLALAASLDRETTGDLHELLANENRLELNLYGKRTPLENQGFSATDRNKAVGSQRKWVHHNVENERQTATNSHETIPACTPNAVDYIFDRFDRYCGPCDAIFTTQHSYRLHIRKPHTTPIILSSSYKATSRKTPDINDPNAHCNVCECKFRTRSVYRTHLHSIHQIGVSRDCEVRLTFICPICTRRYKSKRSCDDHVRTKHNTVSLLYS